MVDEKWLKGLENERIKFSKIENIHKKYASDIVEIVYEVKGLFGKQIHFQITPKKRTYIISSYTDTSRKFVKDFVEMFHQTIEYYLVEESDLRLEIALHEVTIVNYKYMVDELQEFLGELFVKLIVFGLLFILLMVVSFWQSPFVGKTWVVFISFFGLVITTVYGFFIEGFKFCAQPGGSIEKKAKQKLFFYGSGISVGIFLFIKFLYYIF